MLRRGWSDGGAREAVSWGLDERVRIGMEGEVLHWCERYRAHLLRLYILDQPPSI